MTQIAAFMGFVAMGSALGGMARYAVSGLVVRLISETFPWGTLVVNVSGAFAAGCLGWLVVNGHLADWPDLWPVVVTGFLGSYTTVSSFSLQTLALMRDGEWWRAGGNVVLSLSLCLGAAVAGGLAASAAVGQ
ncbi:camphor resistance protein CrcB [Rhodovulum bhavnagarense]|uniref:Fluoride-specific ion channel FluC n=1 Tax=Rhodovulum bhavnagarense TaxID=992286 RepID=A0A4V2SWP4_9RHOB|nr:fluoride efflux transporter CrcB [Rhodovulum bhavnagarense]TCP62996.1 camphor resistance protein CrcB [Rhodovulum bhavnagarense]